MKSAAYFQYYETFEKVVQKFSTAEQRDAFRSKIINFGLFGIEPEALTEMEAMVWDIIRDMIEAQRHRREVNQANAKKKTPPAEPAAEPEAPEEYAPAPAPKEKKEKFKKPTVQEVDAYCQERKNTINAQQFVDYYEARGWKIGNASMKDWKAAVRTWEQRRETPANKPTSGPVYEWPAEKLML